MRLADMLAPFWLILLAFVFAYCFSPRAEAQTPGPSLGWTQLATGLTAADVSKWQWELWVNNTGQLPLVTATCVAGLALNTFDCKALYSGLPIAARTEGIKVLELVAVPPSGIKSPRSTSFSVTVAAAPTSLRLEP